MRSPLPPAARLGIIPGRCVKFELYDLLLYRPSELACLDPPAGGLIFEFENNPALMGLFLLDPVTPDRPPVERRLGAFFVKINISPDELPGLVFIEFPPAAFPDLFVQLVEVVRILDQMDLHFAFSFLPGQKTKPRLIVMDRASILSVASLHGKRGHQYIE
jgi:hypothetical protein